MIVIKENVLPSPPIMLMISHAIRRLCLMHGDGAYANDNANANDKAYVFYSY